MKLNMFPPDNIECGTLASERAGASFNLHLMSVLLSGSPEAVAARKVADEMVAKNAVFDRSQDYRLSKYERYMRISAQVAACWEQLHGPELQNATPLQRSHFYKKALPSGSNIDIHEAMFLPTIRLQASAEQQTLWLPAIQSRAILGTYCQTEIGHGSDVAGLETQATYDKHTEEFEIHTPTVRAAKWWPKGVGRTVTHAVVYARLRLPQPNGTIEDKGVKGFLVQLRDIETGQNVTGIQSGDIGPTIGVVASEQGWVVFDHVRVPRTAMLCRYNEVLADGTYVTHGGRGTEKRNYSTMMKIRSEFVFASSRLLGKACTIAIRYCAVRRQFPKAKSSGEDLQVLDYQGVQVRTLPWIAAAYALHFTGSKMMRIYHESENRLASEGDTSLLAEAHALSSGLKAACTKLAADGIEELRRACGGHGYLCFSGLVELYGDMMMLFSGEGENYMIIQQLTRWLLKGDFSGGSGWASFLAAEGDDLRRCSVADVAAWLDPQVQVEALQHRARRHVKDLTKQVTHLVGKGKSGIEAARGVQWDGIQAAFAVGDALMASAFAEGVARAEACLQPVLRSLCSLYCLHVLERNAADLFMDGYVTAAQVVALREQARTLLDAVRPDAVPLVDAFGFSDNELNSAIGAYDGDVYRRLLEWAGKEPMNEGPTINGWLQHIKPMMERGRSTLEEKNGVPLAATGLLQVSAKGTQSKL